MSDPLSVSLVRGPVWRGALLGWSGGVYTVKAGPDMVGRLRRHDVGKARSWVFETTSEGHARGFRARNAPSLRAVRLVVWEDWRAIQARAAQALPRQALPAGGL